MQANCQRNCTETVLPLPCNVRITVTSLLTGFRTDFDGIDFGAADLKDMGKNSTALEVTYVTV